MDDQLIKNIKNRVILTSDYTYTNDSENPVSLTDNIIIHNGGDKWYIIPLNLALSYPIIYGKYSINNESYDTTLAICPITLRSVIFKGIFEFETYHNDRMILREKNTNTLLPIDLGIKIENNKYIIKTNKRIEVMIMNLRSAFNMAPDAIFMSCSLKIDPVIDLKYYSNTLDVNGKELEYLIHPKTLIYVIQYKSYETDDEKTSLILGKDSVKNEVSGYDIKKSGIQEYFTKHKNQIINRDGYILPMLWYSAKNIYQKSKLIYIN